MSYKAEEYVDAGQALLQLGRMLQRCYPPVATEGSQFDEDKLLAELLPDEHGIYVDIGAHHSRECSNTWQFYKRGWRGLLIEPLPDCWPELLLERRGDILCPIAASNITGFATLRVARSVSSLRPDWKIGDVESIPVRTDTMKNIFDLYPEWSWHGAELCSIDVEGHEKEVLEGINWGFFKPRVIVIEYRDYDPAQFGGDSSNAWKKILKDNGYRMKHQNPLNQIWTL